MDVTAFLSTSATVNGVAEAFSVLEHRPQSIVATATASAERFAFEQVLDGARGVALASPAPSSLALAGAVPADAPWVGTPQPVIGPRAIAGPGASVDVIAGLRGTALLTQLARLPRLELEQFLIAHPEVVAETLDSPPLARDVVAWWESTPGPERAGLALAAPELVGGLDGIPYLARDTANRALLAETVAWIEERLAQGPGRAEAHELETRRHMLQQIVEALAPGDSGLPRTLILLDTTGDGRAAIGIGDLQEADYISYVVPGMFFGIDAQLVAWTGMADALAAEQNGWLARLGDAPAGEGAPAARAATISWIGYETPTLVNVASMDLAREGRDTLTSALQGFDALRLGDDAHVSIFAHSYGSTAAMLALEENDVTVDALAIMGSPGSPAPTAADLKVRDGNVWVGVAWWDPIPSTGVFGSQPASARYGAKHFGVNGTTDPITGEALAGAFSHNDYFTPGSESFRNLALIGIDREDLVLGAANGASLAAGKAVGTL